MGIVKSAVLGAVTLVLCSRLLTLLDEKLPVNFGGTWDPAFQPVVDVFRANVESGREPGAAFAIYHKGVPVIDVWGGYADMASLRPWRHDTTTLVFSCTKGIAAILVAKMVEMGILDYKKPVSYYWPEFAQHQKDNITVEILISHQAGLVYLDEPVSIADKKEVWAKALASQKTAWPAGTMYGYHALTFGLYVDELVQRADPKHRDTATLFQELIAQPAGVDFYMNSPLTESHRTARLVPRSMYMLLLDALQNPRYLSAVFNVVFDSASLMSRAVSAITEFAGRTDVLNNPYNRAVTISSLSGTGSAHGLAKLYGIISNGGKQDGKAILSRDTISRLATAVVFGKDVVMKTGEESSMGLGTMYMNNPKGEQTVGHTGHGGQVAIADIKNNLGIAYLTNHLTIHGIGDDPRYTALEIALYQALDSLNKK